MTVLDPRVLFRLIATHVPDELKQNIIVVGSLAAAYHHRSQLENRGVNTKDADVLITPAAAVNECRTIAERLLAAEWRRVSRCKPQARPEPGDGLEAIRLHPPSTDAYFIELLALPPANQRELKTWIPCWLSDGWYGLPSFRYMGLAAHDTQLASEGIRYASPATMSLSNLLSHPTLGHARITKDIEGRRILRSAKDLGRVLGLAFLAGRSGVEAWVNTWERALRAQFPLDFAELAAAAGGGLRALLQDNDALDEAHHALAVGILAGHDVTVRQLVAIGRQLLVDAIEPLLQRSARSAEG